ncbi:unnamed protein product [Cylindrotheca closterium]|uniref:CobW C-terminal domain-containing protein n=1 Tax=Cylindrotheca closterium TaxID=2856 RepID=A0AAD2FQP3_9STRA|nr:unnamed protein product [Cylindrotheca closterium]
MDHENDIPFMDDSEDDEPPMLVDLNPPPTPELDPPPDEASENELPVCFPCPVTILSGFLGSGKTTLIQYILKSPDHGKRIAVIENEYGEGLAVESMIARDGVGNNNLQDLIELPNGCICCTVKDSLVSTLESLLDKRQDLDYILIEASGMANPGPIASVFWLDEELESRLQLDGIVTLVDANKILEQLETTEEAAQQIAYADRLLINKVDLLQSKGGGLDKVLAALKQLHPTAPTQQTNYSKVPNLDWILNTNCFGGTDRLAELNTIWQDSIPQASTHHHDHHMVDGDHGNEESRENHSHAQNDSGHDQQSENHEHTHTHSHDHNSSDPCVVCEAVQHRHTAGVSTIALHQHGSVDLSRLNKWLAHVLWPNQDAEDTVLTAMLHSSSAPKPKQDNETVIFRCKGIVSVKGNLDGDEDDKVHYDTSTGLDKRRFIVQAVHDLWEVHPASAELKWGDQEERDCKLIVIGKNLNEPDLRRGFRSCF